MLVAMVDLRSCIDQHLHDLEVGAGSARVQRQLVIGVLDIWIRFVCKQLAHDSHISNIGGNEERRQTAGIRSMVDISARREDAFYTQGIMVRRRLEELVLRLGESGRCQNDQQTSERRSEPQRLTPAPRSLRNGSGSRAICERRSFSEMTVEHERP